MPALRQLCQYYLRCLSLGELEGVSVAADGTNGVFDYAEVARMPVTGVDGFTPFESNDAASLLERIRPDRNRQILYLGYPTRINGLGAARKIEPILVFPFAPIPVQGTPELSDDLPTINLKALETLGDGGRDHAIVETVQLSAELGLSGNDGGIPTFEELIERLVQNRPNWDWQEKITPQALSDGVPLAAIQQPGIFNRAVLVAIERSQYTQGLETELSALQGIEETKLHNTALGAWINMTDMQGQEPSQEPLLEVFPLNSEQRQAVRQSLSNPLTVVTGPPGTGKSQVVSSILINAAMRGMKVLFASKNNKAVDVVEKRINEMGPRPILLRLGANQYQTRLAQHIVSLLAVTVTEQDEENYRQCQKRLRKLENGFQSIERRVKRLIALRNKTDSLEQEAEEVRKALGEDVFFNVRDINLDELNAASQSFQAAVDQADRSKQSLLKRLFWPLLRTNRYRILGHCTDSFRSQAESIGLLLPKEEPNAMTIGNWIEYAVSLTNRFPHVVKVKAYFECLEVLTKHESLEDLSRQRRELTSELGAASQTLWNAWLQVQPARMTQRQRQLLNNYRVQLEMAAQNPPAPLQWNNLVPEIVSLLPCWAVASLSARGRVPFVEGFFDLLVIDEASQCDIASALPLLFRARRAVVIGDPKQLRHISTLHRAQDMQLLQEYQLAQNHLGWSYSTTSLFDLACSLRSQDIVSLRDHHRSHADIIEFSNREFYENRLRIATDYGQLHRPNRDPNTPHPAVVWREVQGRVVRPHGRSALNEEEAGRVVEGLKRLVESGYRGSVGVVTPFRAQANRIRELVQADIQLSEALLNMNFLAEVVHKFQGDERDVMIFSPVLSNAIHDGALRFLRDTPNLFNVAVTRARAGLIVVGNQAAIQNAGVGHLNDGLGSLARFASYVAQVRAEDLNLGVPANVDLGAVYPVVANPEIVSDWEKYFYKALYAEGIRLLPQYQVENHILDFVLVDGERRLAIEIDGKMYHMDWDGELCRRDQIITERLLELGWDVMRFWVYQVRDDFDTCVKKIRNWLEQ